MEIRTQLSVIMLIVTILYGCSDEVADTGKTSSTPANNSAPVVDEPLAMPLNTPISEVKTSGPDKSTQTEEDTSSSEFKKLEWDDLMPKDYRIEELLADINAGNISDDDPRIDEAMEKIKEMFSNAPVVEELNNTKIQLPGFVVPLDPDNEKITDFLLVPYYGACIHVPPPPANQTVFVTGKESKFKLYDTVWVKGEIVIERSENDLGDSGYSIIASEVVPYE